ncbi:MAG: hypothetical protein AAB914_01170 [Patescibacteria group bacterium]
MIAKLLNDRIKPMKGFSHLFHIMLVASLPIGLFVLVRLEFIALAFTLLLLSKWRIFAVRMRYWPANIRLSIVDVLFGSGIILAIASADYMSTQLIWGFVYLVWLVYVKPSSLRTMIALQAILASGLFLATFTYRYSHFNSLLFVAVFWFVAYFCARHFLGGFEEEKVGLLASIWAFFALQVAWVSSHWLVFFFNDSLAQPVVLLTAISVGVASLYYLDKEDRLSTFAQKQIIFSTIFIVVVIVALSGYWGDKTI